MKKINLLIIFVLAGTIGFITSCKKDPVEYAAPTITFTTGTQTVDEGDEVTIAFKVTTEDELAKIRLYIDGNEYGDVITEFSNKQEYLFSQVVDTAAEATFIFKVVAEDSQDVSKLSDASVTVTVTPAVTAGPVDTKTALKIYCALAEQTGNGDYASLTPDFGIWNHNQAENSDATIAKIDVCYYNGDYKKAIGGDPHFVSPDACPSIIHDGVILTNAKTTKFKILDDVSAFSDWANIDDDTEISAITGIDAANVTDTYFEAGDIVAFELADGKKGVMKLIDGTSGSGSADYIIVDVIVQQNAPAK